MMEGAGMHKMGWKWTTLLFLFFRFALALFRWIGWLDWLFPVLMNTKRYFGDTYMKEMDGKNFYIRDC